MKVLLTGASGYIGKRLLPELLRQGHEVVCCVRDLRRVAREGVYAHPSVSFFEVDFLRDLPAADAISDIDAAYYLVHSMSSDVRDFASLEERSARNFVKLLAGTSAKQVIYLGGIANEQVLSKHLASRRRVEDVLAEGGPSLTALRAGIIVGSGSASFEIIRDLVEKLPVMVTPRWLNTRCQPISIRNVLEFLTGVLGREDTYGKDFDIGGPDILTYREMLLQFAEVRGLKRWIRTIPVMTPRLSSYWLYFVTSTSYKLAVNLVNSMKVEVIARDNVLEQMLGIRPLPYKEAVRLAFERIGNRQVPSSWKDALVSSDAHTDLLDHTGVPVEGCFRDHRERRILGSSEKVLENIWSIGGDRGWYYGNFLWRWRGRLDKLVGGVGLRRGRTHPDQIHPGEALDFWRVLVADREKRQLLLFAEMKLPGEAWLEFHVVRRKEGEFLRQTATFRPHGLAGRLYWYAVLPFHFFVFEGMAKGILTFANGRKVPV